MTDPRDFDFPGPSPLQGLFGCSDMEHCAFGFLQAWQQQGSWKPLPYDALTGKFHRYAIGVQRLHQRGWIACDDERRTYSLTQAFVSRLLQRHRAQQS